MNERDDHRQRDLPLRGPSGMGTLTGQEAHQPRRDRAEPAGVRRAVRRAQGASLLDLPRARVRRHHPAGRRLVRALPPAHRRDQAEHPPDRPDHRQDAARRRSRRRCRASSGRSRGAPTARSSRRAACTACTPSATAGRTRIGSACATRSFISLQALPKLMPGRLVADTMAVMASFDPVMGGVDK